MRFLAAAQQTPRHIYLEALVCVEQRNVYTVSMAVDVLVSCKSHEDKIRTYEGILYPIDHHLYRPKARERSLREEHDELEERNPLLSKQVRIPEACSHIPSAHARDSKSHESERISADEGDGETETRKAMHIRLYAYMNRPVAL